MGHLSILDVAVLVVYVAGVVALGVYFARKGQTTERFMVAGRSLPGWVVGFSIIGTYVSSISFLANPGKSYGGNWNPWVFGLSLPLAAWIATKFFVPYYRGSNEVSAYSHLEKRFGPWARAYAAGIYILLQLGRMGTIMYLMALPLHYLLGWSVWGTIVVMGVLVTAYTLLGGIEAVIWTDVVQTIVLLGGAVVASVVLLFGMPEGPGQLFSIAWTEGKFGLGSFGPSLFKSTFWVVLMFGLFENLRNFGINQSFIQRYATAKSDREAGKSVWMGALAYLPISAVLFFVGTALFAYYAARPDLLDQKLHALDKADQVFPYFIVHGLPSGLTGLLIAAIFAAGMSSVDSSLNCSATLTLSDFYKRYFRRDAGEKESMRVLQISTVAWGALAVGVGLAMIGVKSALDVWWKFSSALGGAILGLFLLGLLSRNAKNAAAVTGVCVGVLLLLWMGFSPGLARRRATFDLMKVGDKPSDSVRTDPEGRKLPRPARITRLMLCGVGRDFAAAVGDVKLRVRALEELEPGHSVRVPRWRSIHSPTEKDPDARTDNLIANGGFGRGADGLDGWRRLHSSDVQDREELDVKGGRLSWQRVGGGESIGEVGVYQDLDADVSEAHVVELSLDVSVFDQTLEGAVLATDERRGPFPAPVRVTVMYLDEDGAEHRWDHGFICAGSTELERVTVVGRGEGGWEALKSPFHGLLGNVFGTAAIVLVGFLVVLALGKVTGAPPGDASGEGP